MLRNMLVVLFVVGAFCLSATTEARAQGAQDFTVVNKTGVEINALYVTPHDAQDWGEDILGADTLPVNQELDITFAPKERAKLWDLRIEDEDGSFIEWDSLNLLTISKVTLYYRNGKATATVE